MQRNDMPYHVPEFHEPASSLPVLARSASATTTPAPALATTATTMNASLPVLATSATAMAESASIACQDHD